MFYLCILKTNMLRARRLIPPPPGRSFILKVHFVESSIVQFKELKVGVPQMLTSQDPAAEKGTSGRTDPGVGAFNERRSKGLKRDKIKE